MRRFSMKSEKLHQEVLDSSVFNNNNNANNELKVGQKENKDWEKKGKDGKNHHENHHEYQYQYRYQQEAFNSLPKTTTPNKLNTTEHQHILVPIGQTQSSKSTLAQRRVGSRLRGADLYVARLGYLKPRDTISKIKTAPSIGLLSSNMSSLSIESSETPSTGSLHDELSCLSKTPSMSSSSSALTDDAGPVPIAVSSHPCYHCISYMHAAEIRRVFWTNNEGEWESSKMRDLMDALQEGDDPVTGMFVTKHEVLMLRQMGGS
jgi:hypothetical protein